MSILRLAQSPPPSVAATTTVTKAVSSLRKARCGALAVLDAGKLVGILSERDLVHRVLGRRLDPAKTVVADVMTRDVERVGTESTVEHAFDVMSARHIRHLVVVDEKNRPLGLLSHRTIAQAQIEAATNRLGALHPFVGDEEGEE
jgi:CBS domain-containing protein